jgi:hypothetical protein
VARLELGRHGEGGEREPGSSKRDSQNKSRRTRIAAEKREESVRIGSARDPGEPAEHGCGETGAGETETQSQKKRNSEKRRRTEQKESGVGHAEMEQEGARRRE